MRSARAGSIGLHVRWAWGGVISSLFDKYFRVLTLDVVFLVCLTPNQLKVTKMTLKWVPRGTQNPPKIR